MRKLVLILALCALVTGVSAQYIPPYVAPILLNLDRGARQTQPLDQNTQQIPQFYIGDDVALQINLLSAGALIPTNQITAFTNIMVEIFLAQNDTNAPQMSNSVVSSNVWTSSTGATNNFYFTNLTASAFTNGAATYPTNGQIMLYWPGGPGGLTALNLNGNDSQNFWLRCFATATNGVTTTFGEGSILVLNAPITALSPALSLGQVYLGVSNTTSVLIPPFTNFFVDNSNLLNASVPTVAGLYNKPNLTNAYLYGSTTNTNDFWVTNGTLWVSNVTGSVVLTNGDVTASGTNSAASMIATSMGATNGTFTNLTATSLTASNVTVETLPNNAAYIIKEGSRSICAPSR